MNPRMTTIVVGVIILVLGLAGLLYPDRVMGLLGFQVLQPSQAAAALGEIRATYGGLFAAMGAFTIFAGTKPAAHRGQILLVSTLWLAACGGRFLGIWLDGNPGLPGWGTAAFELLIGGALLASWWNSPKEPRPLPTSSKGSASSQPYWGDTPPPGSTPPPPAHES